MKRPSRFHPLFGLATLTVLLLVACNLPRRDSPAQNDLAGTLVAATLQAMTQQPTSAIPPTDTPTLTPTAAPAKVSGKVCYHDSGMIELTLYFQNTADSKLWTQSVSRPSDIYSIDLPAGTYQVYGWPPDYTVGVLVKGKPTIAVGAAQELAGVDFCDYAQGPFAVPYPPGFSPSTARGSISGNIYGYPGSDKLTVVAFNKNTGYWYYVILLYNQYNFSITDLPAGRYQVVAYGDNGIAGGTQPTIYVIGGQNTLADITDWSSNYPANPVH